MITEAENRLAELGQLHLLEEAPKKTNQLLHDISAIDPIQFRRMQKEIQKPPRPQGEIEPFRDYIEAGSKSDQERGFELLKQGKVACLVVAGGQGTRLGWEGPKGTFPVTLIKKKSLFQLLAEKIHAASEQAGCAIPLAIMTSEKNHDATVAFFKEHNNFGLKVDQISFFSQEMLPLLTNEGNLFLDAEGNLARGPDGNGAALHRLVESKVAEKWDEMGINYITFLPIDNPLADPIDLELIGFHSRVGGDIATKCLMREDPEENVGTLVKIDGKVHVIEYTELPEMEKRARDGGHLRHLCANLSLFSFTMPFVKKTPALPLPYHLAYKAIERLNGTPSERGWKFEQFIFDLFPYADRVSALLYPREKTYSPLKNKEGPASLATLQHDLLAKERKILEEITKTKAPDAPIELSAEFYYPTETLLKKWSGNPASPGYVEAK